MHAFLPSSSLRSSITLSGGDLLSGGESPGRDHLSNAWDCESAREIPVCPMDSGSMNFIKAELTRFNTRVLPLPRVCAR